MQEDGEFEDSLDYILSNTHEHTYTLKSWACPHQDREMQGVLTLKISKASKPRALPSPLYEIRI